MIVSVVIPARNAARTLPECLRALSESILRPAEVIVVVDGPCTDATEEVARAHGVDVLCLPERLGPGGARNAGVAAARGDVAVFVDADVAVRPNALSLLVSALEEAPVDAVFGSYDNLPPGTNLASQYKNLLHHFVHQSGRQEAQTFWAGLGAVRREPFERIGGFDAGRYRRPSIEDVELGHRILAAGGRILLVKTAQGAHLKRWDVARAFRTDVLDRALPWTELILETRQMPDDLNLGLRHRLGVASTGILLVALVGVGFGRFWWWVAIAALLVALAAGSDVLLYLARERGVFFAIRAAPLHIAYFLASGLGFALGVVRKTAPRAELSTSHSTSGPLRVAERRRVLDATLTLGLGGLVIKGLGLVSLIWLARVLGPSWLGQLELALVVALHAGVLSTFGLDEAGMQRASQDPGSIRRVAVAVVRLRLALSLAALASVWWLARTVPLFQGIRDLVLFASLGFVIQALSLAWIFLGMERTRYVTAAAVAGQALYVASVVLLVHGPEDLVRIPILATAGTAVTVGLLALLRLGDLGRLDDVSPRPGSARLLVESVPHALRSSGSLLAESAAVLVLAVASGSYTIGLYQAAARLTDTLATAGAAFTLAAFPSMARNATRPERLRRAIDWAVVTSAAGWIVILLVLVPLARIIVLSMLGAPFEGTVGIFRLLLVAAAVGGVRAQYQTALAALDRPRRALAPIWATAFTALALAAALIPSLGLRGAGIAAIGAEVLRLLLTRYELVTVLADNARNAARTAAPAAERG